MTFSEEIRKKQFVPNVVIRLVGQYYCITQPDSGLVVPASNIGTVRSLNVNPTQIDLRRCNTTIASYGFSLLDKSGVITAQFGDRAEIFFNQTVEIWIGRKTGSFDFADYYKLPDTKIKKIDHVENTFNMTSAEETDRMNKSFYDRMNKLDVSILSGTTTITANIAIDDWPTAGMFKIDDEFVSYSGKNNGLKQFTGCIRGEKGTFPTSHNAGTTMFEVVDVSDNPLTLLLQLLVSGGGGGPYDVLPDGLGIDQNLIDIAQIEDIRDTIFPTDVYEFSLYNVTNALKFFEEEILLSCNLRFRVSQNSKISLALLDQSVFGEAPDDMDDSTISSYPKLSVDENKIVNRVEIEWDWDEGTRAYRKLSPYDDATSITDFSDKAPMRFKWKGPKASLGGQAIVDDRADRFLQRFKTPAPEITFKTQIDKALSNLGDKILVSSNHIPSASGTLQFSTELEVISRAINWVTGDVTWKLAFTSYSGIRACYIAPSDKMLTVINQKTFTVAAGRGACYEVGWKMALWLHLPSGYGGGYESDLVNEIESIVGDTITMKDNFASTLIANRHRIKFADYDDATQDQKRYCFISDDGNNFADDGSTYRITF